jgi:hypothetical protein
MHSLVERVFERPIDEVVASLQATVPFESDRAGAMSSGRVTSIGSGFGDWEPPEPPHSAGSSRAWSLQARCRRVRGCAYDC